MSPERGRTCELSITEKMFGPGTSAGESPQSAGYVCGVTTGYNSD